MTAEQAIERSVSHNEIVHVAFDDKGRLVEELNVECEDSVSLADGRWEFWGTTEDGAEWRVHVDPA